MYSIRLWFSYCQLFVVLTCSVYSQHNHTEAYNFERISSKLGLSQNNIAALCQDHEGFLWVGTRDGLNRFDGYTFQTFTHDPFTPTTLSHSDILSLFVDSKGRLWIGTAKGLNLFDRKNEQFLQIGIHYSKVGNPLLTQSAFSAITEDRHGAIWVGTLQGDVFRIEWNGTQDSISEILVPLESEGSDLAVKTIVAEDNGPIWVARTSQLFTIHRTSDNEIFKAKALNWQALQVPQPSGYSFTNKRLTLTKGKDNRIWLASLDGIGLWNANKQYFEFKPFRFDRTDYTDSPFYGASTTLMEDDGGLLWLGGGFSLSVYDPNLDRIIYHNGDQNKRLKGDAVKSFMQDKSGIYWLGTNGKGLYKYSPFEKRFTTPEALEKITGNGIRVIHETRDSILWFSDTKSNLYSWDRTHNEPIKQIQHAVDNEADLGYVIGIAEDVEGHLWIAGSYASTHKINIYKIGRTRTRINKIELAFSKAESIEAFDLHFDEQGNLWTLSNNSLDRFDQRTGNLKSRAYFQNPNQTPNSSGTPVIHQSAPGIFWLGTAKGLKRYNVLEDRLIHFVNDPTDRSSLPHNMIKSICPDPARPNEILWLGTGGGGLVRFDIAQKAFRQYTTEEGLTDDVVYGILPDREGKLWMSTNRGLSKFDPATAQFENFNAQDGLQDDEFNSYAYAKSTTGELIFGGIEGVNFFRPDAITNSAFQSPVVITGISIPNKTPNPKAQLTHMTAGIDTAELSYQHQIFSIEFASLDFTNPTRNQFAYMLEPFSSDWQHIGNQHRVTFTNLAPGNYTFYLKGTNSSGLWSEKIRRLTIIIRPPWWQSWYAYVVYTLVLGGLALLIYRLLLRSQADRAEAHRLVELDRMRAKLYTNITHEFRTPLTVILGYADQLQGNKTAKEMIKRNSKSLLQLVNYILDLSKLKNGQLTINPHRSNIIPYLNYLTESFYNLALSKEIRLVFHSSLSELFMDFDDARIQQIVNNLLSNALKFTQSGGKVIFYAEEVTQQNQRYLRLKISDTGIGIPAEKLPHIFDRFYQADITDSRTGEGTGLGLALTKELVLLMKGQIWAQSETGKGSIFIILLPIAQDAISRQVSSLDQFETAPLPNALPQNEIPHSIQHPADTPLLLIVEDNRDVRNYIRHLIDNQYRVIIAENGKEAQSLAFEEIPDLIISDIIMPEMDGYELCTKLKQDRRTSHIPIVLLTAKTTDQDKLQGLKMGADAYLTKPFNKEELLVRLEQLLTLRQRLREHYTNQSVFSLLSRPHADLSVDDLFLRKLQQVVLTQLEDPALSRETLASAVNLSSSQLYRKLKAVINQTPNIFIRKIRLQKSLELLNDEQLNISEIAYSVGFSDPNYFSKVFKEEFGKSPIEYRK